jgi:spermidine/putrescine transport system ATP-binding protein
MSDAIASGSEERGTAVEVRSVTKIFGSGAQAARALDDVSVSVRENEFFTLLGPSGCGKTTLLRLIAGFEQPTAGEIFLDGRALAGLPPFKRPVNTVFQSYALFPHMTVGQNVAFGLEMQGTPAADIQRRVGEMLELVKLSEFRARKPAQLSGGQQQRVALARALANKPRVLLLDEPLSALDLKLRKNMQIELKRLQLDTGVTFIFVTHDQEEALTMSDRIAVMHDGRVLQVGTPTAIYERPEVRFVADFIGDTNLLEAECRESADGRSRFRLPEGGELTVADAIGHRPGERVTLAVRPERVELAAAREGALSGTLQNIVYFGTDTTYHVALEGGARFQVRMQNRSGAVRRFQAGDSVSVTIPPDAVQVLAD